MEEQKIWEQPEQELHLENDEEQEKGSQLGKFKDAESLLSAYNSLQAEFTKKCQKLSELEKNKQQEQSDPVFMDKDWTNKVTKFLETNKDAKAYASEISNYIINNPEIMNKKDALDIAWAKIMQQKYVAPEKFVEDEINVEKYIMNNQNLKQKIINEYIKQLQNTNPPPVISVGNSGNIAFSGQKKPLTLSDAKKVVEEIFNFKGD